MAKEKYPTTTEHNVVCLWHANCMDGLIAAALTHRFFKGAVECVAVRYNEAPPVELMKGKHVYLVDFTYPVEVLEDHIAEMKSLTIIDHHQDATAPWIGTFQLKKFNNLNVYFNNERAGGMLTWDFFFGGLDFDYAAPCKAPMLVQYAQDYDLWTKKMPNTDEIQNGLRYRFPPHQAALAELADFLFNATSHDIEALRDIGTVIQNQERIMAESLIRRTLQFTSFLDYENIPVVQMPAELANQAGEMIYTRYPDAPFVVLFEDNYKYKSRKYSFRSRREGGANVSYIASRLGGKGHYNSSGATVDLELNFDPQEIFPAVALNVA